MKFYIDFQGGSGWEDITQYVRDNLSVTNRACSDDYKHAVNLLDFELTYESTIFLRLHSTLGYVLVRVLEDDDLTPIFVGRFIPAIDTKYDGIVNNQFVSLTASDYTSRLDIEMEEFVAENCHIMNPADKPNSIVHLLFTHLGLAHSLLDPSVSIMDEVGAATADDASNALDFLSTLLYEYGWVCNWSRAGLFSPIQWIQDDGSTTDFTFDDNNVIGSIQETSKEIELEAAKVYWYGLGTRTNNRIYTESLEYDEDGDFEGYPILRETYFPDEANVMDDTKDPPELQKVEQEYQDEIGRAHV